MEKEGRKKRENNHDKCYRILVKAGYKKFEIEKDEIKSSSNHHYMKQYIQTLYVRILLLYHKIIFASRLREENKGLSVKERRRAGMIAFKCYTVIKQKTIKV